MANKRISDKAMEAIRKNKGLKRAIIDHWGIEDDSCMKMYIKRNSPRFLEDGVKEIIADYTGMSFDEILVSKAGTANLQHV